MTFYIKYALYPLTNITTQAVSGFILVGVLSFQLVSIVFDV